MTPDEERLAKLEKAVQGFNLISSGNNQVQGGFPDFKPKSSLEERLAHLEDLHEGFTIRGGANINAEGSFRHGFAISATCPEGAEQQSGLPPPSPPPPPPPSTGACCTGGGCQILTQEECVALGGAYLGDDVPCDPFPDQCNCPHDDIICVTFEGIVPCSDCQHKTLISGIPSGSFAVSKTTDFGGVTQWEGFIDPLLHVQKFSDDLCNNFLSECDASIYLFVQCRTEIAGGPDWSVSLQTYVADECKPSAQLFSGLFSGPMMYNDTRNNDLTALECLFDSTVYGKDGTVTINSGGCS